MEEIFGKVWVYLAHDSELPNNGDYVRRQIGLQPVILVRGGDGEIRVFFNRCRHRANLICNRDKGEGFSGAPTMAGPIRPKAISLPRRSTRPTNRR